MDIFDITASALTAQRMRMDVISSNLANVNTTRNEKGEIAPYRRKNVIFTPIYEEALSNSALANTNGAKFAQSLSMKPSPSGMTVGADGKATFHLGLRNDVQFGGAGVQVSKITDTHMGETMKVHFPGHPEANDEGYIDVPSDMRLVYDPSHPDAIPDGKQKGYVIMPNVNVVTEMVDMISATRAYEANVTALQSAKQLSQAALEI